MSDPSEWALRRAATAARLGTCNCVSPGRDPCFLHVSVANALDAAREQGRREGLEEAASLCAPRARGATCTGFFVKASTLAAEIRALSEYPKRGGS